MTMNAEHVLNELRKLKTQENSLGLVQLMGTDVDGQMRGKALAQQKFSLNSFEKGFGMHFILQWMLLVIIVKDDDNHYDNF